VLIENLRLFNFKNYAEADLNFDPSVNCFLGKNGSGKTNLLDAIHYLCLTKSAINPSDAQNIKWEETQFFIKGTFELGGQRNEVLCSVQSGQKKIRENEQDYLRFSDHVGKYPLVIITPQDIELIWGGGELRRRFFDTLISQLDRNYLESLISYNHQLKQRNSLLKRFSEQGEVDTHLIESYNKDLVQSGNYIFSMRSKWVTEFSTLFKSHYEFIAQNGVEDVEIKYKSDLNDGDFSTILKENLQRDIYLQRTTSGIHRDDFLFFLQKKELKRIGSQGQQKSFLIALKLTEFQIIAENKKTSPILLLDDIFDKLDDVRIHQLMKLVANGMFGQIFITDARADRSVGILNKEGIAAKLFIVENSILSRYEPAL
jgi:DNA replication and repair protein RecF